MFSLETTHLHRALALAAALLALPLSLARCAVPSPERPPDPIASTAPPVPATLRADAVRGRPVSIPLTPAPGLPSEFTVGVNGENQTAEVFTATPRRDWAPPTPGAWLSWSPPPRIAPADGSDDPGVPIARVEVDGADTVTVGGQRVSVRWFEPAPTGESREAAPRELLGLLEPLLADAARRWRAEMLLERLGYGAPEARFPNKLLDDAHALQRARWRSALEALRAEDERAALALLATLTRVAFDPEGQPVPAWPADAASDEALLETLLREDAPPGSRTSAADAFVGSAQRAAAWILSDIGEDGAVTLSVASMFSAPQLVTVRDASDEPLELRPIRPNEIEELRVFPSEAGRALRVEVGPWSASLPTLTQPLEAAPPGVRMGPLLRTLSLQTWLSGGAAPPAPEHSTAALLQRRAGRPSWELYIECLRPPGGARGSDFVRVWLGPYGAPTAVLRIDSEGFMVDETKPAEPARPITINRAEDAWTALLPLPANAGADGSPLLIAIERVDARGVRSTWPRPVFPWEAEPGRAPVRTDAWRPAGEDR